MNPNTTRKKMLGLATLRQSKSPRQANHCRGVRGLLYCTRTSDSVSRTDKKKTRYVGDLFAAA